MNFDSKQFDLINRTRNLVQDIAGNVLIRQTQLNIISLQTTQNKVKDVINKTNQVDNFLSILSSKSDMISSPTAIDNGKQLMALVKNLTGEITELGK